MSGLLLPAKYTAPFKEVRGPNDLRAFYSWSQVTGESIQIADLISELSKYKRSDVIRWIAHLHSMILSVPSNHMEIQRQMMKAYLPLHVWQKLHDLMIAHGTGAGVLFHKRQLWLLLQFACLACSENRPSTVKQDAEKILGVICLYVNEILSCMEAPQDQVAEIEEAPEQFLAKLLPMIHRPAGGECLVRAHYFWFELPADQVVQKSIADLKISSLDRAFQEKHGLALNEFFTVIFFLHFLHDIQLKQTPGQPLIFHVRNLGFDKFVQIDHCNIAMKHLSLTPEALSYKLIGFARQIWSFDMTPVRDKPLLEFIAGEYSCPDLSLLLRSMIDKIYFMLEEAYPHGKFRQLFGIIFESYIHRVIEHFAPQPKQPLIRHYYSRLKFDGGNDEVCDGLLVYDDFCILFEFKATLFTTHVKYGGDNDVLRRAIQTSFAQQKRDGRKGVVQLKHNLNRILSGERIIDESGKEIKIAHLPVIVPAIVAYDDDLGIHAMRVVLQNEFNKIVTSSETDQSSQIGPFLFLTTRDIEALEYGSHRNPAEHILKSYIQSIRDHPDDQLNSLSAFLHEPQRSNRGDPTGFLKTEHHRILNLYFKKLKDAKAANDVRVP